MMLQYRGCDVVFVNLSNYILYKLILTLVNCLHDLKVVSEIGSTDGSVGRASDS